MRSARAYNIVVGHTVGIACGFAAVAVTHAWYLPTTNANAYPTVARVCAATIAVFATVLLNLLLKSGQPAALATALLITLGNMQTSASALWIFVGVLIITVVGEPIRRVRLRALQSAGKLPGRLTCEPPQPANKNGESTHGPPLAA